MTATILAVGHSVNGSSNTFTLRTGFNGFLGLLNPNDDLIDVLILGNTAVGNGEFTSIGQSGLASPRRNPLRISPNLEPWNTEPDQV